MKTKEAIIALGLLGLAASPAIAEVTSISAKFAGGCKLENTTSSCTIKATAAGTSLSTAAVVLQRSETGKGGWRYVSKSPRTLSATGQTTFRFKNVGGCYRVITAPNGNDTPDIRSRAICEK